MTKRLCGRRVGFTLIEVLVVVAVIALLISILVPSLAAAREQARTVTCGEQLRQIGIAQAAYAYGYRGWLVGSPNTSGNGARAGFSAEPYESNPDHYPALHVFDWANPLLRLMGLRPPADTNQRYAAVVSGSLCCPTNRRRAGPVDFPALTRLIPADALAPSYATARHFLYVGEGAKTGETRGTLWWSEDCVPSGYAPKLNRVRRPDRKVCLADAHVVSGTKGQISNANWGFASQGAWRAHYQGPATYRGSFLGGELWRHRGAINILAFDGHVERQKEVDDRNGADRANGGQGQGARRARWWFPSGTETGKLPSWTSSTEPAVIVP